MLTLSRNASRLFGCVVVGLLCAGCSFTMRTPPSEPAKRTAHAAKECGGIVYPIFDTVSVAAGVTWVVRAEQDEAAGRAEHEAERIAGYGIIGLFGAAAMYGYVVEVRCASLRREVALRKARVFADVAGERDGFPGGVFGFRFDMSESQAQQTCSGSQGTWKPSSAVAVCEPRLRSAAHPALRLHFELGALSRMTVLYDVSADRTRQRYDQLYAALRNAYGKPQVERKPLRGQCASSLWRCLENGQRLVGPAWHWPDGSIELAPVWEQSRAILELRYSRQERLTR